MLERLRKVPGETLDRASYHEQMREETERVTGVVWKLERSQFFHESDDDPAWQTYLAGDWDRSIEIFEAERPDVRAEAQKYTRQGSELRRLRVVEHPISPYLQWEMHSFHVLVQCGMPIRVIDANLVRDREQAEPLPEVIVVGSQVLFEVRYDDTWAARGARRIDDPDVIAQVGGELAALWRQGEPLVDYFAREIAPLPPPPA